MRTSGQICRCQRLPLNPLQWPAMARIGRIVEIWSRWLALNGGPFLFSTQRGMAGAMYPPVATRFLICDLPLNAGCAGPCQTLRAMPEMVDWWAAARLEPDEIEALDMDF